MNIGPLILSVIANMVLGMLWYSPQLFGKTWSKITGMNPGKIDKEKMYLIFGLSGLGAFVTAAVLQYFMVQFEVENIKEALFFGALVWAGFGIPFTMSNNLYQGKPKELTFIDGGYQLAGLLIMSSIIYLFI